jgi:ribosomal protein L20
MEQPLVEGIVKCRLADSGSLTEHSTGQNYDPVNKSMVYNYRRRENVKGLFKVRVWIRGLSETARMSNERNKRLFCRLISLN